jgi:hypothetical protein
MKGSIKERARTGRPTTTNSLESSHGHLNASTPQRNSFWRSFRRIIGMMLAKSTELGSCVRHNFGHEVRESLTRATKLDDRVMQQEIQWYRMTLTSCDCGERIHLSVTYGVRMPCSHQYVLGAPKPSLPQSFDSSFPVKWSRWVLDVQKLEREVPDESLAHITYLKEWPSKISNDSRTRKARARFRSMLIRTSKLMEVSPSGCQSPSSTQSWNESDISVNNLVNLTFDFKWWPLCKHRRRERTPIIWVKRTPQCDDRGDHLSNKSTFPIYPKVRHRPKNPGCTPIILAGRILGIVELCLCEWRRDNMVNHNLSFLVPFCWSRIHSVRPHSAVLVRSKSREMHWPTDSHKIGYERCDFFLSATFSDGDCWVRHDSNLSMIGIASISTTNISLNSYRRAQFAWNPRLLNQIVIVVLDLLISWTDGEFALERPVCPWTFKNGPRMSCFVCKNHVVFSGLKFMYSFRCFLAHIPDRHQWN